MLQQKYLPVFDFSEVHSIAVHQSPEAIFSLVDKIDLRESRIINLLFRLRGITPDFQKRKGSFRERFIELEQQPGSEIILGLAGQFWKPDGNLQSMTPTEFIAFQQHGFLKATWNFRTERLSNTSTLLETETRIACFGTAARHRFACYWFLIKPFSGIIRKEILKLIKQKAETL